MENDFNIKEIVRVESKGKSTIMFFTDGISEIVGNSIDELEKEFADWNFVRIHPRHLINPIYYYKPSRFITPAIEMMDGTLLPVDKDYDNLGSLKKKQDSWWKRILQSFKKSIIKSSIMKKQLLTLIISFFAISVIAQDYSVPLDVAHWNAAYTGPLTELTSSLKCTSVGYRNGNYLTTKEMFNFADKDVYIKWLQNNNGSYMRGSIGIFGAGVSAGDISDNSTFPVSTWIYTRIHVSSTDKSATVVSCTGSYDDAGGVVKQSLSFTVADDRWNKVINGTLYLYFADTYQSTNCYVEVGEVIVKNSEPNTLEIQKVYDFSDGTIPTDFTTVGSWTIDNIESPNGNSMHILGNVDDLVSVDVTNADAVKLRYKVSYPGGDASPVSETTTALSTYGNGISYMALGVYVNGRTSYASDWKEIMFPTDSSGTFTFKMQFFTKNGQELWIDAIEVIEISKAPVITPSQVFSIDENSVVSTVVGTVMATDDNTNTSFAYSINSGNDTGIFSINESTGEITVASDMLDYETTTQYSLSIHVTDGNLTDDNTVTINVNDVNEAPVITDGQVFDIDENSAIGTIVGTVLASDEDAGTTLAYSILLGPGYNGGFNIDSSTGEITSDMELDFETTEYYVFTVRVSDGSLTYDDDVRININNVNEAPVIVSGQTFNINENSSTGTAVGTVSASDVDAGTTLKYSIESGNDAGRFAINTSTGEIIAASDALDFEATNSYTLGIEVSDETLNDAKSITININNVNDNTPVVESAEITIDEGTANGTVIYTLVMSDTDGDLNPLTFTPTADHDALNLVGDDIVVVDETLLDYETDQTIVLEGYASDGTFTDDAILTIHLNNLNDNTPVMANLNLSVRERESNGFVLTTFAATDADGSLNPITYSFVTGQGHAAFTITNDELIVTDGSQLDFETEPSIVMQIEVSDGTYTSTATVSIDVTDIADDAPSITAQPQSVEVCYGEQAILSVTAEGDGTLSYDWLVNGVSLGKPDNATLTLEVGEANETATYSCKVTNEFGEAVSQTATAKMRDMLTVDLGDDVTISTGESVTLNADAGYSSYQWSDNSGAQTLLVEGSVYGEGTHVISVEVTDDFGCPASDDVVVEVTVATDIKETAMLDVKIYPNPTSGYVFAQASGISNTLTIEFINMAGQKMLVKQLSGLQSAEKIDLTGLKNGMYIVKIYNDNYQKTVRIIIR